MVIIIFSIKNWAINYFIFNLILFICSLRIIWWFKFILKTLNNLQYTWAAFCFIVLIHFICGLWQPSFFHPKFYLKFSRDFSIRSWCDQHTLLIVALLFWCFLSLSELLQRHSYDWSPCQAYKLESTTNKFRQVYSQTERKSRRFRFFSCIKRNLNGWPPFLIGDPRFEFSRFKLTTNRVNDYWLAKWSNSNLMKWITFAMNENYWTILINKVNGFLIDFKLSLI